MIERISKYVPSKCAKQIYITGEMQINHKMIS